MTSAVRVKTVEHYGVNMVACKREDGEILVGIKSICDGLGVDHSGQIKRIKRDDVLVKGMDIMSMPTNGGNQDMSMLIITFLPFFLTGIKSSMVRPQIRDVILDFKLKAKDVLASAFLSEETKALNPYDLLLKNINENQRLLVVEQSKLSDKLTNHLETYIEDKEVFNQTTLSIGYEIEGLKQQVNKEIVERTNYIPVKPLIAKRINVLNKVREIMLKKWTENIKHQETKDKYIKRINNIVDNMIKSGWTISNFKEQSERRDNMYAGDDALIHDIGETAYKYYTGSRIN